MKVDIGGQVTTDEEAVLSKWQNDFCSLLNKPNVETHDVMVNA